MAAIAIFIFVFVWNDYLVGTVLATSLSASGSQISLAYLTQSLGAIAAMARLCSATRAMVRP
jgi:multiple sugar transport system permease protein